MMGRFTERLLRAQQTVKMKVIGIIQFSLEISMYSRFERPLMLEVGHIQFSHFILALKLFAVPLVGGEAK